MPPLNLKLCVSREIQSFGCSFKCFRLFFGYSPFSITHMDEICLPMFTCSKPESIERSISPALTHVGVEPQTLSRFWQHSPKLSKLYFCTQGYRFHVNKQKCSYRKFVSNITLILLTIFCIYVTPLPFSPVQVPIQLLL